MNDYIEGFTMEGQVLIDEQDIYEKEVRVEELRQRIGMVFQKPNPFPSSIFENVAFGLRIKGINDKKVLSEVVEKSLIRAV